MRNWLLLIAILLFAFSCHVIEELLTNENNIPCAIKDCTLNSKPCKHCDKHEVKDTSHHDGIPYMHHDLVYDYNQMTCEKLIAILTSFKNEYSESCQGDMTQEGCDFLQDVNAMLEQNNAENCDRAKFFKLLIDIRLFEYFQEGLGNPNTNKETRRSSQKAKLIKSRSTAKICKCKEDLLLYSNPMIEMESDFVQHANPSEMEVEGSLNYVIEPDSDYPNKFGRNKAIVGRYYPKGPPSPQSTPYFENPLVAFLDTGMDPELFPQSRFVDNGNNCGFSLPDPKGWNFISDDNNTHDEVGHGTLVAASFKDALAQSASLDYKILPVKILDDCGYGSMYSAICGLYYAKEKGADIINCSWGLYEDVNLLRTAIQDVSSSAFIVASSGNKGYYLSNEDHYPSEYSDLNSGNGYQNVIEVSGLCHTYNGKPPLTYQFWGKSNTNIENIAESAKGYQNLIDELIKQGIGESQAEKSCDVNGTSYAAPRITAAIAIEWQPSLTNTYNQYQSRLHNLNNCSSVKSYWCDN